MKKLLVCMMAAALAFSTGACGTSSDIAETEAENDITAFDESDEDEVSEYRPESIYAANQQTQDPDEEELQEVELPDVSNAVNGMDTSITDSVPIGTWAATTLYATQDDTFHTVYVRIAGVTTQSDDASYVVSAINANNEHVVEEERISLSDFDVPSDAELVVMDYEVYVPEDFPAPSYGMAEPKLYFTIKSINGTGIPSLYGGENYTGLNATYELSVREPDETYYPGNVYEETCLFIMVKGYTDYVITYFSFPDGTMSGDMGTDNLYTVYHSVEQQESEEQESGD